MGVAMSHGALAAPEAVVFDFGGVLFNWQPLVLIQSVLPAHARDDAQAAVLAQAVFQSFVPGSDWAEFDRGTLTWDEVSGRIAVRTGLPQVDVHRLMEAIPPHLVPVAGTVAWLERLVAAGTRLHFLSNMPVPYAQYLQQSHAFLGHFHSGVFSSEVQQVKPNEVIFHTAAQRFGVEPARTVFIDDHPRNVEVARALGWRAVQFKDAAQCEAELLQLGWL